jgi:beta-mannosidase
VNKLCPGTAYWPSSAHGGSFPHQNNAGTTSYYGVGAYLRELEDARRSELRFATECLAFANVPEASTLEKMPNGLNIRVHHPHWKARVPRDLGAGWDFDDVRDHYVQLLFGKQVLDIRYGDHDLYLDLSRVTVGEVMSASFAEWRRQRSVCNGALIWFLRDFWPGAGWGIVDAQGSPKSVYYYLKRALQPIAINLSDEGCNGVYVHVINDSHLQLSAAISVSLFRHGEILITQAQREVIVAAHAAIELPLLDWFEGFMDLSYAYRFGPRSHDLIVATMHNQNGQVLAQHFMFNHTLTIENDLGLTASARSLPNGDAEIVLQSRRFARAVTIQCDGFEASDQYFNLAPSVAHSVSLKRTGDKDRVAGTVRALNASNSINIGSAA